MKVIDCRINTNNEMEHVVRLMTPSEEQAYLAEQAQMAEEEAERSPTPEEQLRADVDFLLAMGGMIE